jgi:PilZ domain-containing protein
MEQERRGLRFAFSAGAEIAPESSPTATVPARVTELSLQGCFLETPVLFEMQQPVWVKIYASGEYFETKASVLYVRPLGIGLVFRDTKPHFRAVLQNWVLTALNNQPDTQPTPG